MTYALNYKLGGYNPFGYHLLNVVLHTANAVLVFVLGYLLHRRRVLAGITALLFGLHPLTTEVVAWISGRGDVLGTCFFLSAITLYLLAYRARNSEETYPSRSTLPAAASVVAFALALLTKESTVTLIGVLVLYELGVRRSLTSVIRRILPYVAVFGVYMAFRMSVLGGIHTIPIQFHNNPLIEEETPTRIWTGIAIFGKYVALLLYPRHLSADYSYNQIPMIRTLFDSRALAPALSAIGLLVLWCIAWRKDRVLFLGLSFFFATGGLIFANALFPFTDLVGERFMYLPSIGFVLSCSWIASSLSAYLPVKPRYAIVGVCAAAILVCFSAKTRSRNLEWHDEFALFQSAARVCPNSAHVQASLGNELYKRGEYELARACYVRAMQIQPEHGRAPAGLGNVALAQGDFPLALEHLQEAARLLPNHDETHVLLGVAFAQLGRLDQALVATEKARDLNPKNSQTYNNLANLHLLKGNVQKAIELWREATAQDPFNAEALYNLGYNYERLGDSDTARGYYKRFVEVAPPRLADTKRRVQERLDALP